MKKNVKSYIAFEARERERERERERGDQFYTISVCTVVHTCDRAIG